MLRKTLIVLLLSLCYLNFSKAQGTYTPSAENLKSREWFQNARFGMFIHWGVYSLLGDGEWVMNNQKISVKNYEKLPSFFNPTEFNPKEWVTLAKAAGMKYITITSKHHDGFAMYDSKVSDYDIIDKTPYKKDILKMLAEECQKEGIKLFFYHSHLDWHHPEYFPTGNTGAGFTGRPSNGDFKKYLNYMDEQLKELLTNYGPVGGIWFDGMWDKKDADWQLQKTYSLIHSLQPGALIGNNHHLAPYAGEDFQMFEKDLPGQNTTGFSSDSKIGSLPLETCETMNDSWGFNIQDNKYKSKKQLLQYLIKAAGYNANFLLNVGPMPNGKIQPEFVKTLEEIGQWSKVNGETIFGTKAGPIGPHSWGVTTAKGNKVFVHILDLNDAVLLLPGISSKIKKATVFNSKEVVKMTTTPQGVILQLPAKRDEVDTIIELEY